MDRISSWLCLCPIPGHIGLGLPVRPQTLALPTCIMFPLDGMQCSYSLCTFSRFSNFSLYQVTPNGPVGVWFVICLHRCFKYRNGNGKILAIIYCLGTCVKTNCVWLFQIYQNSNLCNTPWERNQRLLSRLALEHSSILYIKSKFVWLQECVSFQFPYRRPLFTVKSSIS